MMKRKNVIMTVDTECSGLKNPVYDIGWTIHDKKGVIIDQYHALVEEIFTDGNEMIKAYFAKKLFSEYAPMLDRQKIHLVPWVEIIATMREHVLKYNVNVLAAYNVGFDQRAIQLTQKILGGGAIFQNPVKLLDLWQFACEVLLNTASFKKLARAEGWVSAKGNIQTNAEVAYRFILGDNNFVESHTAMQDALIETEIAARCFAKKKKIPYGIKNAAPWRIVNA